MIRVVTPIRLRRRLPVGIVFIALVEAVIVDLLVVGVIRILVVVTIGSVRQVPSGLVAASRVELHQVLTNGTEGQLAAGEADDVLDLLVGQPRLREREVATNAVGDLGALVGGLQSLRRCLHVVEKSLHVAAPRHALEEALVEPWQLPEEALRKLLVDDFLVASETVVGLLVALHRDLVEIDLLEPHRRNTAQVAPKADDAPRHVVVIEPSQVGLRRPEVLLLGDLATFAAPGWHKLVDLRRRHDVLRHAKDCALSVVPEIELLPRCAERRSLWSLCRRRGSNSADIPLVLD